MDFLEILKSCGPSAVGGAVGIVIVGMFLKHLASERRADREAGAAAHQVMKEVAEDCHASAREMREAFQKQIAEIEERDETRRVALATLYERDRREMIEAAKQHITAISANGETLKNIENGIAALTEGHVHRRVVERRTGDRGA